MLNQLAITFWHNVMIHWNDRLTGDDDEWLIKRNSVEFPYARYYKYSAWICDVRFAWLKKKNDSFTKQKAFLSFKRNGFRFHLPFTSYSRSRCSSYTSTVSLSLVSSNIVVKSQRLVTRTQGTWLYTSYIFYFICFIFLFFHLNFFC